MFRLNVFAWGSLLFALLIFACYVDVYEIDKSSSSYYSSAISPSNSSSSSSSQIIKEQEPLVYQGQSYRTIKMGSLIWLAENLNAEPKSGKGHWWCHGDQPERCLLYGKLYDWAAAMDACPTSLGWRLPSEKDFDNLSNFEGNILSAKAWWNATFGGYKEENYGDREGFSALNQGYWWSSEEAANDKNLAGYGSIIVEGGKLDYSYKTKARAFSVRCVKDG